MNNNSEFIDPDFKNLQEFVRYCYLYDPLIEMTTGLCFEQDDLAFQNRWHEFSFHLLHEYCFSGFPLQYYYTCAAPQREYVDPYKILDMLKNYRKDLASNKDERRRQSYEEKLLEKITETLNQSALIKQYIYYSFEDRDGWMIIERTTRLQSLHEPLISMGETLPEARINLENNRAKEFTSNCSDVQMLVSNNAPLASLEMFKYCSKLDKGISRASLKSPRVQEWLTSTVPSIYRLKCNSDSTNFSVRVEYDDVQWGVEKVLEIDQELSSLVGQIPVEVWDEDLQSAFQRCEERITELQNNQEELNKAIDQVEQEIMEEERRDMMREGEEHINWLLSEYGEDVFPDRD